MVLNNKIKFNNSLARRLTRSTGGINFERANNFNSAEKETFPV